MTKFYYVLLVLSSCFLMGCEEQEPECLLQLPTFSVNGQASTEEDITLELLANESIVLSTPVYDGFQYHWTGPNGFESDLPNPVIPNATSAMSGTYTLQWTKGICTNQATAAVVVNTTVIPCTPEEDKLTFTGDFFPVTFSTIYTSTNTGRFEMVMNGSGGDMIISFPTAAAPETGVYSISVDCPSSFLEAGQICMSLTYSNNYCLADAGDVYITKLDNGKYTVLFCDIKFNADFSSELIGSALITQN